MEIINLKNVSFKYHNVPINSLKNINLKILKGEVILLTGRSGCGKTTLTRTINGLIPKFYEGVLKGQVLINGRSIKDLKSYELASFVGTVFQDPRTQFFTTETVSECAFGCENLHFPSDVIKERVDEVFSLFQIEELKNRSIFSLSSGEKQKIAIASICAVNPEVYIFDEPSANLDMRSTMQLATVIKKLKDMGKTIIISEHRLYYLHGIVDRVIYMENGEIIDETSFEKAFLLKDEEIEERGLRLFDLSSIKKPDHSYKTIGTEEILYEVENLTVRLGGRKIIEDISIKVDSENCGIVGIIGKNGVGKTTLAKVLCGIIKSKNGKVTLNGKKLSTRECLKTSYFVMQDADYQLFTESVHDEMLLGKKSSKDLNEKIEKSLKELNLDACINQHPMSLSGGQKQRVSIAIATIDEAKIVFFDEPTSGLDGENMRHVSQILKEISREKIIFIISHDIEFIANTCERVLCLHEGKVFDDFILGHENLSKLKALLE
ncbi:MULTISPECIES: ABC transporter ATP-binding protein [Bacillota]|uniref:Energy-coupling factor transport system ATP-binding protein n=1 Tax=Peptostreptococcus russellii TaxID=215200 RepID=A0A1H8IQL8_9FIRM|nr:MULTISPECIES: ABC transporter ATP-binding protein [Bacillota]SEN71200.1 energy-coupling factor transport system ATP-binding protein [Peptostreptococcus russellii]HES1762861.1 ABC transporter ATP-binding protein [Streptococcus pyogenes]